MEILVILPAILAAIVAISAVMVLIERRKLRRLAEERQGETICHFVRSLDYRHLDTKIIRAVYEGLQVYLIPGFPIRASDELDQTYRIDSEDIEEFVNEIAGRCGRTLEGYERNPFYARLGTVSGLIEFLCAQPKA